MRARSLGGNGGQSGRTEGVDDRDREDGEPEGGEEEELLGDEDADDLGMHERLPRRKLPVKSIAMAALLFFIGAVTLVCGVYIRATAPSGTDESERGGAMLLLSFLTLTPGSYASYVLWAVYRGVPGYSYDDLPSYDD